MTGEHAAITADHMLYADLRGIDSHGCSMLVHYHQALLAGRLNATPSIEVVRESQTTALIDGGGGLGHVPGHTAMTLAIAKCRAAGIGAVAVRNSGHFGAAGAYAAMAAEAGYLGLVTSSADLPAIVPTAGKEAMLGTNPIAFTAPATHNKPLLLDIATSTVSLGKLFMASRSGRSIPPGWALDETGAPVTGARGAFERRLLTPLGGSAEMGSHKGYGLAVMVETLSSILPGTPAWQEAPYTQRPVGHFFLAIDPQRFRGDDDFGKDLDTMLDSLRATDPIDPGEPVLVAGDPEYAAEAERQRLGIPLTRRVVEDLRAVASAADVPFVLDT
jgi:LDH2 family malate/lactate/ureidoglycolate dehydrogenase